MSWNARDLSGLPAEEQQRILRRREISRQSYQNRKEAMREARREQAKRYRNANPEKNRERRKNWRDANLEYARSESRRWYHENKDRAQSGNKAWREANPEYHKNYHAERYATDIQYRLRHRLRARLHSALKGYPGSFDKPGCAVDDLGCTLDELRIYLAEQFQSDMSWKNHGEVWEIDHRKPLVGFDLTDRKQFLEACHYTNLQPLYKFDNRSKGAAIAPNDNPEKS